MRFLLLPLLHIALLAGVLAFGVQGLGPAWFAYAGIVAVLVFRQGVVPAIGQGMVAAALVAIVRDTAIPGVSMALGIFSMSMWYLFPAVLLAFVLSRTRSMAWCMGTLLCAMAVLTPIVHRAGGLHAPTLLSFAESFEREGDLLFQGVLAEKVGGTWHLFLEQTAKAWLPLNGVGICLAVLCAWYVVHKVRPFQKIRWGLSLPAIGVLWGVIALPYWVDAAGTFEAMQTVVWVYLVLAGLCGMARPPWRYVGVVVGIAGVLMVQWAVWIFAGFGSLVLWYEGFRDESNIT